MLRRHERFAPPPLEFWLPLGAVGRLRLASEIFVSYVLVRWHMRRKPLAEAVAQLRLVERRRVLADSRVTGYRLGRATIQALAVLPTDSRCLMRSLVLVRLLARRDIESTLIVGAAVDGGFSAHAWVEVDGFAVLPTEDAYGRLIEI